MGQGNDGITAGQMNVTACYRGKTDFEGKSFEDMHAMVANAMPSDLTSTGHALLAAQKQVESIANDLKTYGQGVEWQSNAADAFHEWVDQLSKQSFTLANYTGTAGDHILAAGQALSEVTGTMYSLSKGGGKASESDRQEAINQMNKLTSYYVTSTETISQQEEPVFQPMPTNMMPGKFGGGLSDHPYASPDATTSATTPYGEAYEPSIAQGVSGDTPAGAMRSSNGSAATAEQVRQREPRGDAGPHTSIDSVAHAPTAPPLAPHGSNAPLEPSVTPPRSIGIPHVATTPGVGLGDITPPIPERAVEAPKGLGGLGGYRVPASGGLPSEGGGDGIVGGMPSRNGASMSSPRLPRGTVIGGEGEPSAAGSMFRGPMGAGAVANVGGRAPGAPTSPGRRLASEVGGVVGEAHELGPAAREFTPGGAGLVREGQGVGMMPSAGVGSTGSARRTSRARPDYLEEDEETWKASRQGVVPRVIE
ncbi:WXG100 family type VII secretion target [Streptomyces silvisoli]|uniref:WXG100 family type VII secretion target n=1 Tax=Streptomyces silvisoli TaxID=3034235 RepID=A0ABT5ZQC9_9ACTN|nr:hypothetical protein [Streptomyces silvisoli]MDF3292040.1 hypothetical protein [Streptomyces silvisoli]